MSVIIVKIKNEKNLSIIKQILNVFSKDISIMDDEEYRDSKFAELMEEGRKSAIASENETKLEFKKRGFIV